MADRIDPEMTESLLIASCINNDKVHVLGEKGILPGNLVVYGDVLGFVLEYHTKYGKPPEVDTIRTAFPSFPKLDHENCDFDFLVDVTIQNGKEKRIKEIIDRMITLNQSSPDRAIEYAVSEISNIEKGVRVSASYFDGDPSKVIDTYLKRRKRIKAGYRVGLPTGIPQLDREFIGFVPGDFVMVAGPPNVGKSWLLLKMCSLGYGAGCKVLFISPEMCEEDISLRLHSILGRVSGNIFSNEALTMGSLDDKTFDDYVNFLDGLGNRNDWIIIDEIDGGQFTISKIESLIKIYTPDIVAVDSIILTTASDGTPAINWQPLIEVAYGLKMLATRSKTIIMVTAPTDAGTFGTVTPATMSELGLSKNMGYAIDIGVSISASVNPDSRNIAVFKKRKGKPVFDKEEVPFHPDVGVIGL